MSVSRHVTSSLAIQIPVFVFSVITGVLTTRLLGPDGKGVYSIFQANTQLFVLLFTFSMNTGITYFIANSKLPAGKVAGISVFILCLSTVVLSALLGALSFSPWHHLIVPEGYNSFYYNGYLVASFVLMALNTSASAVFQGKSGFPVINGISLANSLVNIIVFSVMIYAQKFYAADISVKMVFTVTLVILFLNSLLWLFFYSRKINIRPDFSFRFPAEVKVFFIYIGSIYAGTLINFMNYRLDLWIVNQYCSESELGLYSLAGNIVQLFLNISVIVSSVLLPFLSQASSRDEFMGVFRLTVRMNFLFVFTGVLLAFLTCDFLIPFVYGKEFAGSVLPFVILLPGVLLSCTTQLFATLIVARNKNRLNIIATGLGLVVTLVLDLLLIPEYGIKGASIATTVSYTVIFAATFMLCITSLGIPFGNYFVPSISEIKKGWLKIKSYFYRS